MDNNTRNHLVERRVEMLDQQFSDYANKEGFFGDCTFNCWTEKHGHIFRGVICATPTGRKIALTALVIMLDNYPDVKMSIGRESGKSISTKIHDIFQSNN